MFDHARRHQVKDLERVGVLHACGTHLGVGAEGEGALREDSVLDFLTDCWLPQVPIVAFPEAREVAELGGTKGEHTEWFRRAGSRTGEEVANGRGAISSTREEHATITERVGGRKGPDVSHEFVGVVGSGHQVTVDTDDVRGGVEEGVLTAD